MLGAAAAASGAFLRDARAQGLAPGTIKLLSRNPLVVDAGNGEAYVQITATTPGKFLIVGPGILQADLLVNLKANETNGAPTTLDILVGGKEVKRFVIRPRATADTWKGRTDIKPAAPVGFLLEVDPGPHAYEFKVSGSEPGAGLLLQPQAKAKRPLGANAPLVPAKPPTPIAAATPHAGPTATPPPAPTPTPKSIDQIVATGGRPANARLDRFPREVSLLGGAALPGDSTFKTDASMLVEARYGLGDARTLAAGLAVGVQHFGGVATQPHLAVAPSAVNVDMTPVMLHLTWYAPLDGAVRPYVTAGPGFVYALSDWQTATKTIHESKVGPAADAALGFEVALGGTDFHEGKQKILLEARESWANVKFEAHDFKQYSSTEIMLGVAMKF